MPPYARRDLPGLIRLLHLLRINSEVNEKRNGQGYIFEGPELSGDAPHFHAAKAKILAAANPDKIQLYFFAVITTKGTERVLFYQHAETRDAGLAVYRRDARPGTYTILEEAGQCNLTTALRLHRQNRKKYDNPREQFPPELFDQPAVIQAERS